MFARTTVTAAVLVSLLTPTFAKAQANLSNDRPRLTLFANGGGASSLTDLNSAGSASFETGWTAGGGVGYQLNRYLAVRGTFDYARADAQGSTAIAGQTLNRFYYGGDVQLRYPTSGGIAPYLLLGAGAVTIDAPDAAGFESFTKLAGKGGLGIEYALPNSDFGLYAQATSYLYDADRNGFDKTQADVLWTAGLTYRLPI